MVGETTRDRASCVTGSRVLVVDDDWDAALILSTLLDATGNKACIAHDGLEAIATAAEFRPDLILMDIAMPGLDGCEAAKRIRAKPWGQGITIAALTGWNRDDVREWAKEAGFDYYFVKPVDFARLQEVLAKPMLIHHNPVSASGELATVIHCYPTQVEAIQWAAAQPAG